MNFSTSWSRRRFGQSLGLAALGLPFLVRSAEARPITAAVIGHTGRGDYGHGLETIFQGRPEVRLVGLADPDPAGRARVAARIGAKNQYADHRELLQKERPNLVSVAMRHAALHHRIVLDALLAGAHVYCEKPFTASLDEADELLRAADRNRRKLAVAHTMRLMPVVRRLRRAWRDGVFGDLVEMRAYGKQDHRAGGEDMMVLGSHLFDLMRCFAGDPVSCSARVLWQGRNLKAADARRVQDDVGLVGGDEVSAEFQFGRGVVGSFTSKAAMREVVGPWGLELSGSRQMVRIHCDLSPRVFVRRAGAWSAKGKTDEWMPLDVELVKSPPDHNRGPVDDWLEAIAHDREPECSGRNGAWAVEMVQAVYQSALSRSRVNFPLGPRGHPLRTG